MNETYLEIGRLNKTFPSRDKGSLVSALEDINLKIPRGSFVTLLGPSGCGKSTLLNAVSGLLIPTEGKIQIGSQIVFDSDNRLSVPPGRRDISMVFQSYAIWPHMTVYENVAFPIRYGSKRQYFRGSELKRQVMSALDAVGMADYAHRPAPFLSGGQQQRVSLARALAQRTELILLDEPLSNLDANLRDQMQAEISRIIRDNELTALYVTHDQKEAMSMADQIVVMDRGRIQQVADPETIYRYPANRMVAGFVGKPNVIEASIIEICPGSHITIDNSAGLSLQVDDVAATSKYTMAETVSVMFRQESIHIYGSLEDVKRENIHDVNIFDAKIIDSTFHGPVRALRCIVGETVVEVHSPSNINFNGDELYLHISPKDIHIIKG